MIQWMMAISFLSFHGLTHGTFPKRPKCWPGKTELIDMEISHDFTAFSVGQVRVRQIKAPCATKTTPSFHQKLVQELKFHGNSRLNMISPIGSYNPITQPGSFSPPRIRERSPSGKIFFQAVDLR